MKQHTLAKCLGPLLLSALTFFLSYLLLQQSITLLGWNLSLLSEKNWGKIFFTLMVFFQIFLFFSIQEKKNGQKVYELIFGIFRSADSLSSFFTYFSFFALFHFCTILFFVYLGYARLLPISHQLTSSFFLKMVWGCIATFFLVWTEESIFRGALYLYFRRFHGSLTALLITSFCFMVAHSFVDPIIFFTQERSIALGLFLFGMMLNAIFLLTGSLAAGMGAHAGVVIVKVLQRKIEWVSFMPCIQSIWLVDGDLRQSLLAQLMFFFFFLIFFISYKISKKA